MTWNPEQYRRFRAQREQPFHDLLDRTTALIGDARPARVIDLGCGSGRLTRQLHERLGAAHTVGIDSSPEMLADSAAHADSGVSFARMDIGAFADGADVSAMSALTDDADDSRDDSRDARRFDVVFSNAALHWQGDHEHLLAALLGRLRPGGALAIQVPANADHASHRVAAEVAAEPPFADALNASDVFVPAVLDPRAYDELLYRLGCPTRDVWLQIYGHELPSVDEVVEWVRGSLLTAYLRHLPAPMADDFLARYRQRLRAQLPDARPYYYTYKRISIVATAPSTPSAPEDRP